MTWTCSYCGQPNLMNTKRCSRCGKSRDKIRLRRRIIKKM